MRHLALIEAVRDGIWDPWQVVPTLQPGNKHEWLNVAPDLARIRIDNDDTLIGLDFGLSRDPSAFVPIRRKVFHSYDRLNPKTGNWNLRYVTAYYRVLSVTELDRMTYVEQADWIAKQLLTKNEKGLTRYRNPQVICDATGAGAGAAEILDGEMGRQIPIHPILININDVVSDTSILGRKATVIGTHKLLTTIQELHHCGQLTYPADSNESSQSLVRQLQSFPLSENRQGFLRRSEDRVLGRGSHHYDSLMALAIATCWSEVALRRMYPPVRRMFAV